MRLLVLFLLFFFIIQTSAKENSYLVLWKLDLSKEISKNKYSFNELSEYIYKSIEDKKVIFYTDSICKNKLNKETFTQGLYEKNQSVAGYTTLYIQEEWTFNTDNIVSKIVFLSFENPNLSEKDIHRNLYVLQKHIPVLLKGITLSGYYMGRADIPFSEWIKKHDFEYTILKSSNNLPQPPYTFLYDKKIDDTTYKKIQIFFDFFPQKNQVFNHSFIRDNNTLQNFSYLEQYNNEPQNNAFRNTLLEVLQKKKLLKQTDDIEEMLQNNTGNYVFYFEAIQTQSGLEWKNIRVYISLGKQATLPQLLLANLYDNKVKSIEAYFKKNSTYSFTEYFTKAKIDCLVSYINNSFAKDAEEGLMLRQYLFGY